MDTQTSDEKNRPDGYNAVIADMMRDMTMTELDGSISHNFIVQAVPHYTAAAKLSGTVLKYTENCASRRIAEKSEKEHIKMISEMKTILQSCAEAENSGRELALYTERAERIIDGMFAEMNGAFHGEDADCRFLRTMLPHHRAAVRMAENALDFPIHGSLAALLETSLSFHTNMIYRMELLSETLRCGRVK